MGLRILFDLIVVGGVWCARRVFGGMCKVTRNWSELRLWSLFVLDV